MEYSKIQMKFTRNPTFRSADPAARGVWVSLNSYCATEENGGRIVGCKAWNDRKWMVCADATGAEVQATVAAELAAWDGDDLVVFGYDIVGEQQHSAARVANKARADAHWGSVRQLRQQEFHAEQCRRHAAGTPLEMPAAPINDAAGMPPEQPAEIPISIPIPISRPFPSPGHSHTDAPPSARASGSQSDPPSGSQPGTAFSKDGLAASWADKNPKLVSQMVTSFEEPHAKIIDVLRYFRVRFEARGEALEGEWQRESRGQQPVEVFLTFAHAAVGSIRLPSHYRDARRAFETSEALA